MMKVMSYGVPGPRVPPEAPGPHPSDGHAPVAVDEQPALYADGERVRRHYATVMEMVGRDEYDGNHITLKWRADATVKRSWASAERPLTDSSLVCDLGAWR
jgi:hypothetical protein